MTRTIIQYRDVVTGSSDDVPCEMCGDCGERKVYPATATFDRESREIEVVLCSSCYQKERPL